MSKFIVKKIKIKLVLLAQLLVPIAVNAAQTCDASLQEFTPSSRFSELGDGTVMDNKTNLMWAKCPEGLSGNSCSGKIQSFTLVDAQQRAEQSTLANHQDWRLPNIKELASIIERRCLAPAVNLDVFPNTPEGQHDSFFWSSTPHSRFPGHAWHSNNSSGVISIFVYKEYSFHVRLVRKAY